MKIILLFLLLQFEVQSIEKHIGVTVNWEPYYGKDLPGKGLLSQLTIAAFKAVGVEYDVEFMPWKRALKSVENGDRLILHGAFYNKEREKKMFYSDVLYFSEVVFIQKKKSRKIVSKIKHLKGKNYKIGIMRGAYSGKEFEKVKKDLTIVGYGDYLQGVNLLNSERIDLLLESKITIKYYMKRANIHNKNFVFASPPLTREGLYLAFSKKKKESRDLRDKFNKGLKKIKKNGLYNKILAEHEHSLLSK